MQNPYQSPESVPPDRPPPDGESFVTPLVIRRMRETRPWVRLVSILGFIMVAMMVVSSLSMMVTGISTAGTTSSPARIFLAVVYLGFALLYFVPPYLLSRYVSAINNLIAEGGAAELEEALLHQKSFWKFVGILALVALTLGGLLLSVSFLVNLPS